MSVCLTVMSLSANPKYVVNMFLIERTSFTQPFCTEFEKCTECAAGIACSKSAQGRTVAVPPHQRCGSPWVVAAWSDSSGAGV